MRTPPPPSTMVSTAAPLARRPRTAKAGAGNVLADVGVRAITVQQPWAWAIVSADKNVENRSQMWSYRGRLLIHAGARWSQRGDQSPLIRRAAQGRSLASAVDMSAVIGTAVLVDCHLDVGCCKPWGESAYVERGGRKRRRVVHLVLEDREPLPEPIPCPGALGLWIPPVDVAERAGVAQ
ncbi:hypothetical protein H7I87_27265 [Mycobacterium timonense]|uniref:ASCH domain-containing protein n=2 Tax=Mycobacterium TaxID=1763 RepID=A0AAW5S985_MYCBC|nr:MULTISPECIES: hypothetical protein [Mycobacterium]MCV6991653.1 hypothetical protein [Mycobacterium bouchedurhonense]MCV6998345.1 hypothetical protein [Mycobacterium timonense]